MGSGVLYVGLYSVCIISICAIINVSGQVIKGEVGGGLKNPFGDCTVVAEGNEIKCKPKGHHENQNNGQKNVTTNQTAVRNESVTEKPKLPTVLFNCTRGRFQGRQVELYNCTIDRATENVTTLSTSTTRRVTLPPTTRTTVDMALVFAKLGISTEAPRPTTPNPFLNWTLHNQTFNATWPFNETHEFNYTEFVIETLPNIPPSLIEAYAEIEKDSNGKPEVIKFDRVPIPRCKVVPHPVTKIIYFFEETQIIAEYEEHKCDVDYSDYCKKEWKDCQADGIKLCPKTCNKPRCLETRSFGYVGPDRPKFRTNSTCVDDKRYDCMFLKQRGECLSNALVMSDLCPDMCHFCKEDATYLPWMPEYRKILLWMLRYNGGKYAKYAQALLYDEFLIHNAAKRDEC